MESALRPPTPIASGRQRRTPVGFRLEADGPEGCNDEELLGVAIADGVGGMRVARRLIDRFGSLTEVVRATPAELRLAGLGDRAAVRLAVVAELGRRAARSWPRDPWTIRSPADAAEPLMVEMSLLEREELRTLLVDTKNVVIARRTVYRGNLAGSSVRVGEVFRDAVRACAAAVVVVHNHPSGDPAPSAEDIRITAEMADAGRLLDIELLDHLIIGRGRWTSLRAVGAVAQRATMR
jgi:DNA repair protein RadC